MPVYTATFSAISVAAAQDLFELVAHASSRVEVCEIEIGQYSDAGDAEDEMLSLLVIRGNTTTGSGGAAVTPVNMAPWSRAAVTVVARNNTTVATAGSPATLLSTAWNVRAGWYWRPQPGERILMEQGQRLVVRTTAPTDALTMNGTIKFRELGLY